MSTGKRCGKRKCNAKHSISETQSPESNESPEQEINKISKDLEPQEIEKQIDNFG